MNIIKNYTGFIIGGTFAILAVLLMCGVFGMVNNLRSFLFLVCIASAYFSINLQIKHERKNNDLIYSQDSKMAKEEHEKINQERKIRTENQIELIKKLAPAKIKEMGFNIRTLLGIDIVNCDWQGFFKIKIEFLITRGDLDCTVFCYLKDDELFCEVPKITSYSKNYINEQ